MKKGVAKAFAKGLVQTAVAFAGCLALTGSGFAFTAPASGDFFYDIYDILVNKMIKGPVGTGAGVGLLIYGGVNLALGRWAGALFPILGGATLVKADTLSQSIGMTINHF